jgi:hypothetical protein
MTNATTAAGHQPRAWWAAPAGRPPAVKLRQPASFGRLFRRVNGHLHLPKLRTALDACLADNVSTACQDQTIRAAWWSTGPPPKFNGTRGNLLGGHVKFGEYALDTVHGALHEEIGQALTAVKSARVLENIFAWGGGTQHEIVFLFAAVFADEAAYGIGEQAILDARSGIRVI